MDIKELDKKQLILLTLLITFVVSIATGIITVSLMSQAPKAVPQTINNVIQRTIEKVSTVQVPVPVSDKSNTTADNGKTNTESNSVSSLGNGDTLVSIYLSGANTSSLPDTTSDSSEGEKANEPTAVGQGIIISDVGLILVDSSLIKDTELYKVVLDKTDYNVSVLKRFDNGFTILKISAITDTTTASTSTETKTQ